MSRGGSVRSKVMWVVLSTTFAALLLAGSTLLLYELRAYETTRVAEIQSVANIISRATAPAIAFEDPKVAADNLKLLAVRPKVLGAAVYKPNGSLFATYVRTGQRVDFPRLPDTDGHDIVGERVYLWQRIVENNEVLGTLVLAATYEPLERLKDYLAILGAVMLASMVLAIAISAWLQGAVTRPILDITRTTREVMNSRDFSLRARRSSDDEVGELADAFNGMLAEVGQRSSELEITNLSLQHEMKEKQEAEAALREADRRKDEFLATLAHELRNPLAPLRNGLEILRMPGADAATVGRARDMMERQLKQMVRLVDDLLDVSRITTGKLVVKKERVDLQAVVKSAIETARPFIESRSHVLDVDVPDTPIHFEGDATRIAQVLSNLLNNAARYTDPGGQISLTARLEGDQVRITVADNGIGIAPDMQPAIFDMFTQVDQSLERRQAGLGVGLTLAKKLVELHGGTIAGHSDGLGRGSRFTVTLPHAHASPARATPTGPHPAREDLVRAQRILLADDNVDFVNSMATLLSTLGHEVRVANNGVEALRVAADFNPDFAFLDIGMPMMNGYELAKRLRKLPALSGAVLTAVSGWGQESDRQRAREAGFDHHLVKPVDIGQLESIIAG